jgi:hypothetical protein
MLKKIIKIFTNYKYNITYIALIVLLNTLFTYIPLTRVLGYEVSPMDWVVGVVYVLRDFAQQEWRHKVIFSMLIGSILSFVLASQTMAIASMSAFLVAECVDWAVYTLTRRPLSQRIVWSASLSAPIDSIVFLTMLHQCNGLGVAILSLAKIAGVFIVWVAWHRHRASRKAIEPTIALTS